MSERRDAELRINEKDRAAIKAARNEHFDKSTALGFVARYACEQLAEDSEGDSGGVRL
ncbi:hypothetical protein [Haloplanus halobius]|jgi:hypothetical protein|uniref:hypothetical protein n=1 Tax=Haloplanus halobius TaxID=2934938 RepID=UPI0020100353|nr:hypothetical protein [Haloplanus sp. XH21]